MLARVAIDFRRELTLVDDAVLVTAELVRIGNSSLTLREQVRTLDGELAAESEAVVVARDRDDRSLPTADRAGAGSVRGWRLRQPDGAVKMPLGRS